MRRSSVVTYDFRPYLVLAVLAVLCAVLTLWLSHGHMTVTVF